MSDLGDLMAVEESLVLADQQIDELIEERQRLLGLLRECTEKPDVQYDTELLRDIRKETGDE